MAALPITIQGPEADAAATRSVTVIPTAETYVELVTTEHPRVAVSGSTSHDIDGDKAVVDETSATVVSDYSISVVYNSDPGFSVTWTSLDTDIATVADGFVTWVANGDVHIRASTVYGDYKALLTNTTTGGTVTSVSSYVPGSLGYVLADKGKEAADAGGNKTVYSTRDNDTPTYVYDASCWVTDYDWTGVSVWNSNAANRKAGTVVTDRHLIHAWHAGYTLSAGTTVRFVQSNGTVITRTVTARAQVGQTDIGVSLLDSALPTGIAVYPVFPADWQDYFTVTRMQGVIGVAFDQEKKALAREITSATSTITHYNTDSPNASNADGYASLTETLISGDSGSPMFVLMEDQPVLLGTHYGPTGFQFISEYLSAVNTVIDTLLTGYSLTTVDVSLFPDFTAEDYLIETIEGILYKQAGTRNSKPYYVALIEGEATFEDEDHLSYNSRYVYWTGSAWRLHKKVDGNQLLTQDDESDNDVATPNLATFSEHTFTLP